MLKKTELECYPPSGRDFLSAEELAELTPAKVIARTRELTMPLRQAARGAEDRRRPDDALWDELRRSGYFHMLVPKEYGGLEASVDEIVDATLPLAAGCASTAWLAIFGLMHNRHMVGFPKQFQDELFADGGYGIIAAATIPPGKAIPVEGGYRLSGHWRWCTCLTQADWVMAIAAIDDGKEGEGPPAMANFMVPIGDLEPVDTWDTDGMRATGTHDVVAEDVFVPEHRVALAQPRDGTSTAGPQYDNPIYRVPLSPLLAFTTAVPVVGAARAAVDLYRERLEFHVKRGTEGAAGTKQAAQIRLGRADAMVSIADQAMRQAMKDNFAGIELAGDEQVAFRSRLRARMTLAAQMARDAVRLVCDSTGSSIHFLDNPMQRILRDITVMTTHIIFDDDVTMEQNGRGLLGLPPTTMIA